jgi:hypothetical protein
MVAGIRLCVLPCDLPQNSPNGEPATSQGYLARFRTQIAYELLSSR